jgi:AMMECR1 domain-containing protein
VPGEQGWDLETTLDHLARKAGLAPDRWRRGARIRVFEAEVF